MDLKNRFNSIIFIIVYHNIFTKHLDQTSLHRTILRKLLECNIIYCGDSLGLYRGTGAKAVIFKY